MIPRTPSSSALVAPLPLPPALRRRGARGSRGSLATVVVPPSAAGSSPAPAALRRRRRRRRVPLGPSSSSSAAASLSTPWDARTVLVVVGRGLALDALGRSLPVVVLARERVGSVVLGPLRPATAAPAAAAARPVAVLGVVVGVRLGRPRVGRVVVGVCRRWEHGLDQLEGPRGARADGAGPAAAARRGCLLLVVVERRSGHRLGRLEGHDRGAAGAGALGRRLDGCGRNVVANALLHDGVVLDGLDHGRSGLGQRGLRRELLLGQGRGVAPGRGWRDGLAVLVVRRRGRGVGGAGSGGRRCLGRPLARRGLLRRRLAHPLGRGGGLAWRGGLHGRGGLPWRSGLPRRGRGVRRARGGGGHGCGVRDLAPRVGDVGGGGRAGICRRCGCLAGGAAAAYRLGGRGLTRGARCCCRAVVGGLVEHRVSGPVGA